MEDDYPTEVEDFDYPSGEEENSEDEKDHILEWCVANWWYPYPTEKEAKKLGRKMHLSLKQVKQRLVNLRRRKLIEKVTASIKVLGKTYPMNKTVVMKYNSTYLDHIKKITNLECV